jgi:four helix bundle protein
LLVEFYGMSRIERFEDLIAWQKARLLAKQVYAVTKSGEFQRDFGLSSQMQRAAVSILSNIAEGHERAGSAEYARFLSTAKGSCAELRAQLYVAFDVGYIDEAQFGELMSAVLEVGRLLFGLRAAVINSRT